MPHDPSKGDILNVYLAMTHLNFIKQDLIDHFKIENEFNDNVNSTFISAYATGQIRSVLRSFLSFLTTPIVSAFYAFFMHIAMIWGVILTIMVLRKFLPAVCSSTKNFASNAVVLARQYRNRQSNKSPANDSHPSGHDDEVIVRDTRVSARNQNVPKSDSRNPRLYPNVSLSI